MQQKINSAVNFPIQMISFQLIMKAMKLRKMKKELSEQKLYLAFLDTC